MLSYLTILSATLPVFLIMGIGFLFQRRCWIGEETEMGMMKIMLNLLMPCLILTLIPGNPALEKFSSAGWAIGIGFSIITAGIGISWLVARLIGIEKGKGLRTFALTTGIQNYGFLTLPIVLDIFPDNSGPAGLVFVHGIGVEIAMWTVGLAVLSGTVGFRSLLNGPFIAVLAALFLNYTGLHSFIPEIINTVMEMFGRCAVPIAVFMIGATMGRFFGGGVFEDVWRVSGGSIFVRLVLMASVILLIAKYLPMPDDLKRLLVVQAGMPTAIFPIVLARMFGGRPSVAIQVVIATSLVSMVSSPLVIAWGLRWVTGE